MHLVIMGVSGSGKTTVARLVAQRAELSYAEADQFHTPTSIAKMSQGTPLTDEDRLPWLHRLAAWISDHQRHDMATVLACSALRRHYRDILRSAAPDVRFVHLTGHRSTLARRLEQRRDHFMPAGLLDSQLDTLEELEPDEPGYVLDVAHPAEELAETALHHAGLGSGTTSSTHRPAH
ncbi:gluconokinase [Lipingzhangella sp. LS1_29]|uniref:Gluconokinase n=1 Tax=Lipingzhangella rawalii TaxID=2055835 RepID=A0ABU2H7S4_9ACTN|nr:gluconokinase [Lipingzhangella rawalii]MDS1270894.1 gluconokinase [Lipingzhangella rawalii]